MILPHRIRDKDSVIQVKPVTPTYDQPRPPLTRLDSRTNISPRVGFPNQQGGIQNPQFRPQLAQQQPRAPFAGNPQYNTRPQLQRNPSSGQFNPQQGIRQGSPNTQPGLRPAAPFPRPPSPRSPGIYPQKSFPTSQKPFEQPQINRSQTLDSPDLTRNAEQSPPATPKAPEEVSNLIKSINEENILKNNTEIMDEKIDEKVSSRPESRSQMMKEEAKVIEDKVDAPKAASEAVEVQKSPIPEKKEVKIKEEGKVLMDAKEDINRTKSPEPPKSPVVRKTPEKPKSLRPDSRTEGRPGLLSPNKSEGDNDSGVDESTQGNEQSVNGDRSSKSAKIPIRNVISPTKNRSLSRGSKSPHLKTPESPTPSLPGSTTDKKKVPMNKIHVGGAPSPNLKEVRSKIGSLQNTSYKPGGGHVKIESKKIDMSKAQSRIAAKNQTYIPGGGEKKIENRKLQWNASSKVGSMDNATHKPKGGEKKIESIKLDFKDKAKPKVGSKDNMRHQPGGGDVKIETKKLDIKAKSKIGSLDNMKHRPGGGDKKIFDDKDYLRQKSGVAGEDNSLNGSQTSIPSQEPAEPISDENLNRE